MARTYTNANYSDGGGNASTNAAAILAAIKTNIIANSAWSLTEEFTNGTTSWKVFKCASASSGLSKDIYFVIGCQGAQFWWAFGEDYNTGTHTLTNAAGSDNNTTRAIDTSTGLFSTPASVGPFGNGTPSNSNSLGPNLTVGAASMMLAMMVDVDHLVIIFGSFGAIYAGAMTSLVQTISDPMPVGLVSLTGSGSPGNGPNSGMTRHPGLSSSPAPARSHSIADARHTQSLLIATALSQLPFGTVDHLQNDKNQVGDVGATHYTSNAATAGFLRAKLKKAVSLYASATWVAGDTVSINGTTWIVASGANSSQATIAIDSGA